MSRMRMYQDAEQELTDAFFNIMEVNRHTFKFRVIIQIHQLEVLKGINGLRNIFKEKDDD
jgi:hypothetical protein